MKYLKMVGLVLLYALVPLAIDFSLLFAIQNTEPIKSIVKVTPSAFFGIFDPISVLALIFTARYLLKKKPFKDTGFNQISGFNSVISIILGILIVFFTFSLINMDVMKEKAPQIGWTINFIIGGNFLLILYIVAVNSLYKEYCFRGLIFNEFKSNLPVILAIICQALIYGIELVAQTDVPVAFFGFIGQIVFGLIFYFGRSIWASTITQYVSTIGMAIVIRTDLNKIFSNQNDLFLFPISIILIIITLMVMYHKNKSELKQEQKVAVNRNKGGISA